MNVNVISREIIKPSQETPKHLNYLQASLFDHANSPAFMPLIYFFSPQNNTTTPTTTTIETILDRLKGSLPDTLSVLYPLAGRLESKNGIICNDEGVLYVEAKVSDPCFEDIVHKADVSHLDSLLPYNGQHGFTNLLLAIQVTTFPCGGLSIGVKMSHSFSDAFLASMFVKTWASIAYGNDHRTLIPRPYFETHKIFPMKRHVPPDPNPSLVKAKPVTKRFRVTKEKLYALRKKLYARNEVTKLDNNNVPSLVMILSAFIWSRVKLACRANDDRPCRVFHAVNIRPKVKPPKQFYYFGNFFVNAVAKPSMSSDTECICWEFLSLMKESINFILKDDGIIREIRLGKEDLSFVMDVFGRASRGEISLLGFSNLRSLRVYDVDFGWGKPLWVTSASLVFKDLVILIPAGSSREDMNVDAYITLSYEEMAKLESDKEFLSVVSIVPSATSKL